MARFVLLALAGLALVARSENPAPIATPDEFLAIQSLTLSDLRYHDTPLPKVVADLNPRIKALAPERPEFRIEIPFSLAKGVRSRITLERKSLSIEAILQELARQSKAEVQFTTDRILLLPPAPVGMNAVLPHVSFQNTPFIDAMNQLSAAARAADSNQLDYHIRLTPVAAKLMQHRTLTLDLRKAPLGQVLQTIFRTMQPPAPVVLRSEPWEATIAGMDEPDPIEIAGGPIMQRAAKITLPAVEFKESPLSEVFARLHDQSKAADPQKRGIALELSPGARELPIRITVTLRHAPLSKALVYVANLAELECKPQGDTLVFSALGEE